MARLRTTSPRARRPWGRATTLLAVLACVALALAANLLTGPADGAPARIAGHVVAGLASAAALAGAARRRRSLGAPGWLLASAVSCGLLGDLAWFVDYDVFDRTAYPDWPEVLYLAQYPLLLAAGALLVRRRSGGQDPAALLDAAAMTVGLGVVVHAFLVADVLADSTVPLLARLVGVAYPLLDVLVLGVVARLLVGPSHGRTPLLLLVSAVLCYLVGDLGFSSTVVLGSTTMAPALINVLYSLFGLLTALALHHPDAARLVERSGDGAERVGAGRIAALAAAGLLAPATLLVEDLAGRDVHVRAAAAGAGLLFVLTLLRMLTLVRAVERQRAQLEVLARTDGLTGLPNRRSADEELRGALVRAARDGAPVSAALLDLDRFKRYNDAHGHPAGDELLRSSARAWGEELRRRAPGALLARFGGEEFAVVLPGLGAAAGAAVVARLLAVTPDGQSFSAGVATWDGAEDAGALLARADERLYAAKAAGRARVLAAA